MILKQTLKLKYDTDRSNTEMCFNASTLLLCAFFSVGLDLLPMEISTEM